MVAASLAIRRVEFDRETALADTAAAKSDAFGSTAHRQYMRAICARELHKRAEAFASAALDSHKALSAPPTSHLLVAAKDWCDKCISEEAAQLAARLPQPRVAFGDEWKADTLDTEAGREENSAHARLDAEWARLERMRIERALRRLVRISRTLVSTFRVSP
jgi:hypothetical protein